MANRNNYRTVYRRLETLTWAVSGRDTLDILKSYKGRNPIAALVLRFAGTVTAAGGGAVSGLTQDASLRLLARRMELNLDHKNRGTFEVLNLGQDALSQLWHLACDIMGREFEFTDPTPGAGATGSLAREFVIPFHSPYSVNQFGSYLDPRDLESLQLKIEYATALTDYASTNVSTFTGTVEVGVLEIVGGIAPGRPAFLPSYKSTQAPFSTTTTDGVLPGIITGGFIPILSVCPHDDSATGNARRNAPGLFRRITAEHGGDYLNEKQSWEHIQGFSRSNFPLAFTTTQRNAPLSILADQERNFQGLLDNRRDPIAITVDTSTTPPDGTTAVTPAAGDRLDVLALTLFPANRGMEEAMEKSGYDKR